MSKQNDRVKIIQMDVRDYDKYPQVIQQVEEVVKDQGLNLLFNNAGISPKSSFLGLKALKTSELMDVFEVNCVAPLMLTKAFIPLLKKASTFNSNADIGINRALIVNMSSILGSMALNNDGSLYHYRTSKSALNAATKSLSIDLKNDKIMSVAMHPNWVKTRMGGPKAPMEVEDSCKSMVETIINLKPSHNGGFVQYDGKTLPW